MFSFFKKRRPSESTIGFPTGVQRLLLVTNNEETGNLEGLPRAWKHILNMSTQISQGEEESKYAGAECCDQHLIQEANKIDDDDVQEKSAQQSSASLSKSLDNYETCSEVSSSSNTSRVLFSELTTAINRFYCLSNKEQCQKSSSEIYTELRRICNLKDPKLRYSMTFGLGKISSGVVFVALDKINDKYVAVKTIDMKYQPSTKQTLTEIRVLREVYHKNIVSLMDTYLLELEDQLWVIMEYMDGGSLTDVLTETVMKERQIACVCREVLNGISFLHSKGISHSDIKSENVLLRMDGAVKLISFKFCCNIERYHKHQTELDISCWLSSDEVAPKTHGDIWSIGTMVIEMIEGSKPCFHENSDWALYIIEFIDRPNIRDWHKLSPNLQNFLSRCLQVEVNKRATAEELLDHPFLEDSCELAGLVPYIEATKASLGRLF